MKPNIVISDQGLVRKLEDVEFAEKIVEMRKNKDPWEVIDVLLTHWAKKAPDEVEAMAVNVDQYRDSQLDEKYATTKDGKYMDRRFTLAFPRTLMLMIRTIYKSDELKMDNKFFNEFARRYPDFRVAQKV